MPLGYNEAMSDSRKEAGWPVVVAVVLAVVLVALGGYVGAYFGTCIKAFAGIRFYRYEWQAWAFQPAATAESAIRGFEIVTAPLPE